MHNVVQAPCSNKIMFRIQENTKCIWDSEVWLALVLNTYVTFLSHEQLIWKSYIEHVSRSSSNRTSHPTVNMERTSLVGFIHTSFFQKQQRSLLQLCVPHEAWPSQNMASSCSSDYPSTQKETNNMMRCAKTTFQLHTTRWKESTMLHNFGHKLEAVLKMVAYSQCVLLSPNRLYACRFKI